MPNDVKAIVSAVTLIVAAMLACWSGSPIRPDFVNVRHRHRGLHGGGDVDFPRGRGQERGYEKGETS